MKIACFPSDRGGCGAYRCVIPARALHKKYGWEFRWWQHDDTDDLVVLQRPGHVQLPEIVRTERRANPKARYSVDNDDWFYGFAHLAKKGVARAVTATMQEANAVSVSTATLQRLYSQLTNTPITVVPNYLDWGQWEDTERPADPDGYLRVGYMGMLKTHMHDLQLLRGVLGPWFTSHPKARFVWVGRLPDDETSAHDILGIPEAQRVTHPAVPFIELAEATNQFDVGIVPLMDGKINDSKSALKGMEYGACSIPCVASPTVEYRKWVIPGINGYLADKPAAWRTWLNTYYEDRKLLAEHGAAARQKAFEHRIEAHVDEWHGYYEALVSDLVKA